MGDLIGSLLLLGGAVFLFSAGLGVLADRLEVPGAHEFPQA